MANQNHLKGEKSPYLLQHATNPVDWYPWGAAAFEKARSENKPVFLSIGYATCHWCHVMARESFEDQEVADFLNSHFVCIKVDREERPDIDATYMAACQVLTGQGGWPLSVFLAPDASPFYAGTYFPKNGRFGMPGFKQVLEKIAELWKSQPWKVLSAGKKVSEIIEKGNDAIPHSAGLTERTLEVAFSQLRGAFDETWGGFGNAPKFPTPHHLTFLLMWFHRTSELIALNMVKKTLLAMRSGGVFDQIGFGFHRYSVDASWHVPHFEKMLYDQALLMMAYTGGFQATNDNNYADVSKEIFTYIQRDMTHPNGGFYSAEDADSDGKEGLFYLWTPREVRKLLGKDRGELICRFFNITEGGNFESGMSIPRILTPSDVFASEEGIPVEEWDNILGRARQTLFNAREKRNHPMKDDKILTSWNGLMIAALSSAAKATQYTPYLEAAKEAEEFLWHTMIKEHRLYHRYRDGDVAIEGFLEDYAFLAWGLLELYESSFNSKYLEKAIEINREMIKHFWDEGNGGFFFTRKNTSYMPQRSKEIYDGAIPSANSVALSVIIRLGHITGESRYHEMANELTNYFSSKVSAFPMGYTQFLNGLSHALGPSREIVVVGDRNSRKTLEVVEKIQKAFVPNKVVILYDPVDKVLKRLCPYLSNYPVSEDHTPVIYICEKGTCQKPIDDPRELEEVLKHL